MFAMISTQNLMKIIVLAKKVTKDLLVRAYTHAKITPLLLKDVYVIMDT